jgi:fructose-specific phosphotransferase system component IIB
MLPPGERYGARIRIEDDGARGSRTLVDREDVLRARGHEI